MSSLAKLNVLESRVKRSRRPVDQYRTAHELTQDAAADFDPEFWRKKGEYPALLLNKTAAEFLREVMGGPGFNGVFLSAEEALDLAETAGKQIHLLEYVNFPKARDAIREIQEALREASAWGNVTAVVVENRSDAAVRRTLLHERFHLFQSTQKGGLGRGAIGAGFLQDSLARSAAEIIAERTRGSVEDVWHEVPAYIAAGQGQTLALTQAEGLRLFGRYLELLRQHYGQKAVDAALAASDPGIRSQYGNQHESARHERPETGRPESRGGVSAEARGETPGREGSASEGSQGSPSRHDEVNRSKNPLNDFWNDESGELRIGKLFNAPTAASLARLRNPAKALAAALNQSWLAEAVEIVTLPLETRLEKEGQGAGRGLMDALRRARDMGEVSAGKRLARLLDATLNKLTRAQRFNLLDVLEGRGDPESGTVRDAFQVARAVLDDIAGEAEDLEVMIQTSEGKQPFEAAEDYFPHMLRGVDALRSGPVRRDVIENLQRRRIRGTAEEAAAFLDEYIAFLDGGARPRELLGYMVETGQATDEAEALAKLQRSRKHIQRQGSIEFAREVNLPFYDPDPARVLPTHAAGASIRLAQIVFPTRVGMVRS